MTQIHEDLISEEIMKTMLDIGLIEPALGNNNTYRYIIYMRMPIQYQLS